LAKYLTYAKDWIVVEFSNSGSSTSEKKGDRQNEKLIPDAASS